MEISPFQAAIRLEINALVAPENVDALSNALKDKLYEFAFYEAELKQDHQVYKLLPPTSEIDN